MEKILTEKQLDILWGVLLDLGEEDKIDLHNLAEDWSIYTNDLSSDDIVSEITGMWRGRKTTIQDLQDYFKGWNIPTLELCLFNMEKETQTTKSDMLEQLKELLERHNKDSRKYLDDFYKKCKEGEVDDLDWVQSDNEFSDFVSGVDIEYNRIYDIAILHLTNEVLTLLNEFGVQGKTINLNEDNSMGDLEAQDEDVFGENKI